MDGAEGGCVYVQKHKMRQSNNYDVVTANRREGRVAAEIGSLHGQLRTRSALSVPQPDFQLHQCFAPQTTNKPDHRYLFYEFLM